MDGEDQSFRINFGEDGMMRLKDRVKEKLKEYMGDYTDDTLVEYVLVLLSNGRRKDEARRELNVFLGDDSVSFVSWLWDHLSSSMDLYLQPNESLPSEVAESDNILDDQPGSHIRQLGHASGNIETDSESEREKSSRFSRSRRNREWKGLVQEEANPFTLGSTLTEIPHSEEKLHSRSLRRPRSPRSRINKKQSREEERRPVKRDAASHPVVGAPRRLLQFAVRDAVRTVQQSSSRTEPTVKRLRSVVSTAAAESSVDDRHPRIRSVARVPGLVSTALKAAAEAAEDASKGRYSATIFHRLSHSVGTTNPIKQSRNSRESMLEDGEYEYPEQIPESNRVNYHQRSEYDGDFTRDRTMVDRETVISADSASDNDDAGITRHQGLDTSQSASSFNKDENSLSVQYSVARDADGARNKRFIDQDTPASASAKPSSKIVNISVNVNTWKPPHYEVPRDVTEAESPASMDKNEVSAGKINAQVLKQDNTSAIRSENGMPRAGEKEPQKAPTSIPGSYTTSRPSEDVDSRTVFVSNVHFAATKDTLSRHFNKFGEVLKVIIVNDATTGQPTGSAYVEFLRKESAESALSLNGTSFMSRILKVVRKSSMHNEAGSMLGWSRIARASPFASRLSRVPFPRGLPGGFRARLPIKPGARSLQWKRGGLTVQSTAEGMKGAQNASITSGNVVSSPTGRNLTYVRPETKADGSSGPA